MPEERDIEKQLRAYGQQRRTQAPQELHPATRRLLQAEVARQFRPEHRARRASPWLGWWRPWVWVSCLLVGLGTIIYITILRPSGSTELAQAEPSTPGEDSLRLRELKEAAPASALVAAAPLPPASADLSRAEPFAPVALAPATSPVVEAPTPSLVRAQRPVVIPEPALAAAQAETSTPQEARVVAQTVRLAQDHTSPRGAPLGDAVASIHDAVLFTNQNADRTGNRALPLDSFHFVLTSNALQLVDRDGSVYEGAFEDSQAGLPRTRFATSPQLHRAFEAAGTNSTVQRRLLIRGIARFEGTNGSPRAYRLGPVAPTPTGSAHAPELRRPVQVDATVTLDDGSEVRIQAVPAEP